MSLSSSKNTTPTSRPLCQGLLEEGLIPEDIVKGIIGIDVVVIREERMVGKVLAYREEVNRAPKLEIRLTYQHLLDRQLA
jgi:hypothetical protein